MHARHVRVPMPMHRQPSWGWHLLQMRSRVQRSSVRILAQGYLRRARGTSSDRRPVHVVRRRVRWKQLRIFKRKHLRWARHPSRRRELQYVRCRLRRAKLPVHRCNNLQRERDCAGIRNVHGLQSRLRGATMPIQRCEHMLRGCNSGGGRQLQRMRGRLGWTSLRIFRPSNVQRERTRQRRRHVRLHRGV